MEPDATCAEITNAVTVPRTSVGTNSAMYATHIPLTTA